MSKAFERSSPAADRGGRSIPSLVDLTCHVESAGALHAAVDNGADCIHLGYSPRSGTYGFGPHAFQRSLVKKGIRYALSQGSRICLNLNDLDFFHGPEHRRWMNLDRVLDYGIDEATLSSPALILYLRVHHPHIRIRFMASDRHLDQHALVLAKIQLGVERVVLPRVFSLAHLHQLASTGLELDMFASGIACSVITARACDARPPVIQHGLSIEKEPAGCACGDASASNDNGYARDLYDAERMLSLLPKLNQAGIRGLILETQGPEAAQMAELTRTWRNAINASNPRRALPVCIK